MKINSQDSALIAEQLGLPPHQSSILRIICEADRDMRTSEVIDLLPESSISRQHAIRLIGDMVEQGILIKTGAGPQTAYTLNDRTIAKAYLQTDWLLRSEKPFNLDVIESYTPNQSRYLPANDSSMMRMESLAAVPTADTLSEVVFRRFMIDFTWASSRLEGNTYSLLETIELLENGKVAPKKSTHETQMIRNHGDAIGYVIENARNIQISPVEIRSIHALLSKELLPNPQDEGRVRQSIVEVSGTAYRPEASPHVLNEGLDMICRKAIQVKDPYEQSVFLMEQISYLQAFIDVNKRTARVVASLPLLRAGLCPLSFYGMNEEDYTKGLVSFYELNNSALTVDAYKEGYRSSVERFKLYKTRLADEASNNESGYRPEASRLVSKFINSVAIGAVMPDAYGSFFRASMEQVDTLKRDALYIEANRQLKSIDQPTALAHGVSRMAFTAYQNSRKALGLDSGIEDDSMGRVTEMPDTQDISDYPHPKPE
jgi:prophage maintenance system killer protein